MNFLRITYEGPGLREGRNGHMLEPAMLGLSDLLRETARVLWEGKVSICIETKPTFRAGSFGATVLLYENPLRLILRWLSGKTFCVPAMGDVLIRSIIELIRTLQWMRGRELRDVRNAANGRVQLVCAEDAYTTDAHVIALLDDAKVRQSLWMMISPLEKDGIEGVSLDAGETKVFVHGSQSAWFGSHAGSERVVHEDVRAMPLSIVTMSFTDRKWLLSDGSNEMWMEIADEEFLSKVHGGKVGFAKGDVLVANVRTSLCRLPDGRFRTRHSILRVIGHRTSS